MKNMMKKDNIDSLIKSELFSQFCENERGTVGVEIELPIVSSKSIEMKNIQKLFYYLISDEDFIVDCNDNEKNIIRIMNKENKDKISLEYSLNTLEFSLKEDYNIYNIKNRLDNYIIKIQKFLNKFDYKLIGNGINPNYKKINRHCLKENRYLIIEKLLTENNKNNKLLNEFCSYICSTQTHLTPRIEELPEVMNVFSCLEWVKSYLYANSYMNETNYKLSRDYLWEISNFEKSNTGTNNLYYSINDIVQDYKKRKMHLVQRNNNYYLVESLTIEEYFKKDRVRGKDYNNNVEYITPLETDIHDFRSYKNIELTRMGTIEIRSDCTQELDNLFEIVAFNVGILKKYKIIEELIKKYKFDTNYIERRKKFNKMSILNSDEMNFVNEVIDLIYLGLQEREYNEENLLKKVREMRKYNEKSRFMVL